MKPTIVEVKTKKQLKQFVHWQNEFYKDCPYYTPAIEADEVTSLTPEGNAAFEFCTAKSWLAYGPDGKIVGRVTGIINPKANEPDGACLNRS